MNADIRQMLVDQAVRLLDAEAGLERLRGLLEEPGSFDRVLWGKAIEMGWPAITAPEAAGGLELSLSALADLMRELGRRTASLPLVPGHVAVTALSKAGIEGELVASLAAGERIAALALCEAGESGLEPAARFAEGRIDGVKAAVAFGAVADVALVSAQGSDGPGLYLVDLSGNGVTRDIENMIDNARAAATLRLEGASATPVLAGRDALLDMAAHAAVLTAWEQVGGSERCLEIAVAYAKERKVFGQPIGAFQAIKHKLADMYQEVEIARGCAIDATEALEAGRADFLALACTARLGAGAAYDFCGRECIQAHGGIGVTWEAEPHHHYRRARALALETGATPFWRELLVGGRQELEAR